jgi:integrase
MITVQEVKSRNVFRVRGPHGTKSYNITKLGKRLARVEAQAYADELNHAIHTKAVGFFYSEWTLLQAVEEFYVDFARLKRAKESLGRYKNELKRIVGTDGNKTPFSDVLIKTFKLRDADEIVDYLYSQDWSTDAVERTLKSLKFAFRLAVKRDWLKVNPMAEWKMDVGTDEADTAIKEEGEVIIPAKSEVAKLLRETKDPKFKLFYQVAATTGLRPSELCGLTWSNIDFANNFIYVKQQRDQSNNLTTRLKTKNSNRRIPLVKETKEALLQYQSMQTVKSWLGHNGGPGVKTDLVFVTVKGNSYARQRAWENFQRHKRLAGVDIAKSLYTLRHFYASNLIDAHKKGNISFLEISRFMGHRSYEFTETIYGHLIRDMEADQKVVDDLSQTLSFA